jgi:hypothetical protein
VDKWKTGHILAACRTGGSRVTPEELARSIIDASLYMVLGTSDASGKPWASPVYFAHQDYHEFIWVSRPERRHSVNITERSDIAILIFDSSVPIGTGRGVYMTAEAREAPQDRRDELAGIFSERSLSHGGTEWGSQDVAEPAPVRLYIATALEQYVVDGDDNRVPIEL